MNDTTQTLVVASEDEVKALLRVLAEHGYPSPRGRIGASGVAEVRQ